MKKFPVAIVAAVLAFNVHSQELPKTQIKDLKSGKKVAFNETFAKGKVTLVGFWGTWCVPGKREVKTIFRNMADWKKHVDFNYLAIATEEHRGEDLVRNYALAQGWNFPCYIDPNAELKRLVGFHALPYIMIIDKKGKLAYSHTGYQESGEILAKLKEVAGTN